jgi:hypothetical protein
VEVWLASVLGADEQAHIGDGDHSKVFEVK